MIEPLKASFGLLTKVVNIKTKESFIVSTVQNPSGVYETAAFKAPNLFILSIIANFTKPIFIVNSGNYDDAALKHTQTCQLFEQLNPRELTRKYKESCAIDDIHILTKEGENPTKRYFLLIAIVFLQFIYSFASGFKDPNLEIPMLNNTVDVIVNSITIGLYILWYYLDLKDYIQIVPLKLEDKIIGFIFLPYHFFKTRGFGIGVVYTVAYFIVAFLLWSFYYLGALLSRCFFHS